MKTELKILQYVLTQTYYVSIQEGIFQRIVSIQVSNVSIHTGSKNEWFFLKRFGSYLCDRNSELTSVWSVGNLKIWALIWCNKRRSGRKIFRGQFWEERRIFLRNVNCCLVLRNDVLWTHTSIVWVNSVDIMMSLCCDEYVLWEYYEWCLDVYMNVWCNKWRFLMMLWWWLHLAFMA